VDRGQEAAGGAVEGESSVLPGRALAQTREPLKFFGSVDALGRDRRVNRFEMSGREIETPDLEAVFADVPYHSLQYNGLAYVLTTAREVTADTVLGRLSESRLPISYFRDISRSAKSVLQDDGAP
jgi:hypothetical protein